MIYVSAVGVVSVVFHSSYSKFFCGIVVGTVHVSWRCIKLHTEPWGISISETLEDTRPDLPKATYDDLLSYYNQPSIMM